MGWLGMGRCFGIRMLYFDTLPISIVFLVRVWTLVRESFQWVARCGLLLLLCMEPGVCQGP